MVPFSSNGPDSVPTVLDWSDDAQNPLKTEYIITEHVDGVQLRQQWEIMNPLTHLLCVESLAKLLKELNLLQFPWGLRQPGQAKPPTKTEAPRGENNTPPVPVHRRERKAAEGGVLRALLGLNLGSGAASSSGTTTTTTAPHRRPLAWNAGPEQDPALLAEMGVSV
ncbi:hypothetical protein B0T24DRAFT_599945 [Lasiosphaeria ovina]|uniref:Aminoglycoside phosphotransferase domain-containing protein n=1 Tax=Lasiosphaeria ovina TaxID=92902 RepID=A0AAE0JSD9_9PEZI|nr:hypothetical protein B0T24DRAFT_599945 [Lasiosphaeria ovina]